MRLVTLTRWLLGGAAGLALVGCAAQRPVARPSPGDFTQIPRISALYAKATQVHVHRFRKPYVDEQARMLRSLAAECDKVLAETQSWEGSARLTAAGSTEKAAIQGDIEALRTSLVGLRDAASAQDVDLARLSHLQALYAYNRVREQLELEDR
jgi:hypothetical protein